MRSTALCPVLMTQSLSLSVAKSCNVVKSSGQKPHPVIRGHSAPQRLTSRMCSAWADLVPREKSHRVTATGSSAQRCPRMLAAQRITAEARARLVSGWYPMLVDAGDSWGARFTSQDLGLQKRLFGIPKLEDEALSLLECSFSAAFLAGCEPRRHQAVSGLHPHHH